VDDWTAGKTSDAVSYFTPDSVLTYDGKPYEGSGEIESFFKETSPPQDGNQADKTDNAGWSGTGYTYIQGSGGSKDAPRFVVLATGKGTNQGATPPIQFFMQMSRVISSEVGGKVAFVV